MRIKIIINILLVVLMISCKKKTREVTEISVRPVKYAVVASGSQAKTNEFSGVSRAGKNSNLSFRVSGAITNLNVKEGDEVKRGERLASIDPTDFNVQLSQAQASLKAAEVQFEGMKSSSEVALSNFRRVEKLYEVNSVSLSDYEQAKTNYENAKAQLKAGQANIDVAKAQLNAARNQVGYTSILAPYNGRVDQLLVEVNEMVNAGAPVMNLSASGNLEIQVGIPELYIAQVKKGQNVEVKFSSIEDKAFNGKVNEIGVDPNSSTFPVTILLSENAQEIRAGLVAKVKFNFNLDKIKQHELYPVVPVEAVGEDANGNFVFLLEEQGNEAIVKKRHLKLGKITLDGYEVLEGLSGGEKVATAGLRSLLVDMRVKLIDA